MNINEEILDAPDVKIISNKKLFIGFIFGTLFNIIAWYFLDKNVPGILLAYDFDQKYFFVIVASFLASTNFFFFFNYIQNENYNKNKILIISTLIIILGGILFFFIGELNIPPSVGSYPFLSLLFLEFLVMLGWRDIIINHNKALGISTMLVALFMALVNA